MGKPKICCKDKEFVDSFDGKIYEPRNITGNGNNIANPTYGEAEQQLLRLAPSEYADGFSAPAGPTRPSAREISNEIFNEIGPHPNSKGATNFLWLWGQFVDHNFTLVHTGDEVFNIPVPAGDPFFDPDNTGTQIIPLNRSVFDPNTGTTNPRQQINSESSYLDGSAVYGSSLNRNVYLREFVGGRLKTSTGNLLPCNNGKFADPGNTLSSFYIAGDERCNEHIGLASIHTLFVREHNYWASLIGDCCSKLSDEEIYQRAKIIVEAEIQAITFNEFLPMLLGQGAMGPYKGYDPKINATIANEFATAAFRFGHTLVASDMYGELKLKDTFFASNLISNNLDSISHILQDFCTTQCQELDHKLIGDLRNFLFGQPGHGGLDLASLNIQRGRDHGLANYNAMRKALGLKQFTSFSELTSDPVLQQKLASLYGNINNIDLFVGGLVEEHKHKESMMGTLFHEILKQQFEKLRSGDRFWYEKRLTQYQIYYINQIKLSDIIRRNTTSSDIQLNAFLMPYLN